MNNKIIEVQEMLFKETKSEKDNLILLHKNCENCGAPLKLNKETMTCKCDYCNTEYYVKNNLSNEFVLAGQLVKINIRGQEKQFYIAKEEFSRLYDNARRDINGRLMSNLISVKEKLTLIEI